MPQSRWLWKRCSPVSSKATSSRIPRLDVAWRMMDALLAALGQDDTAKKEIKKQSSSAIYVTARDLMRPLGGPAFAKRKFGAAPPKRVGQTPKA